MSSPLPSAAQNPLSRTTQLLIAAVITAFALVWFGQMGGYDVARPTNIDWMFKGDYQAYIFCSAFTRNGPWSMPLGAAPDLLYPYGTTAAINDCVPLLTIGLKAVSPLLPLNFQLFGLWMLGCLIASGLVGARLLAYWVKDPVVLTLGGMLFVADPLMPARYGHPQFFTQAPLLALVGMALIPIDSALRARRAAFVALGCAAFLCSVNGYLAVMACALVMAVVVRIFVTPSGMSRNEKLLWLVLPPIVCTAVLWVFGYLSGLKGPISSITAEGFGEFSADLDTFFNPMHPNWRRIMPVLGATGRQGEGYAYLGMGVLLLLLAQLGLFVRALVRGERPTRARWLQWAPIVGVTVLCFVYAASSIVTFGGHRLFDLSRFYAALGPYTSVFRASGRFAWPLHALLYLAALAGLGWLSAFRWAQRGLVGLALVLQVADLDVSNERLQGPYPPFQPLPSAIWSEAPNGYSHFLIHPVMAQWACPYDEHVVAEVSWEAYRRHMSINSALLGRYPAEVKAACMRHLEPSQLDPATIYIVYFREFLTDLVDHGYSCGAIDGLAVCVSQQTDTPLRRAIEANPLRLR